MNKLLKFQHVSLTWPDFSLKDISLSLDRGYIMGLVGYNGAGKTTLFRLIENQYKDYKGTILVDGFDCRTQESKVKDITAFISDEQQFFFEETATTNATIFSPYYSTWDMKLFHKYLNQFEISSSKKLKDYSRGSFIKFQLAFAIAHHPVLYVMDEPTAGLDPVFRYDFLRILQEIIAEEDASILLSTHNTGELDKIADFITMIENGRILFSKDVETLSEEIQKHSQDQMRFQVSNLFKKGRWNL